MHYSINISVSKDLKNFVEETVKGDAYTSASDFLRMLLREYQRQQEEKADIEALLMEAINDPRPSITVTPEYDKKFVKELTAEAKAIKSRTKQHTHAKKTVVRA